MRSVDGVIIECGAFLGATSLMIALLCKLSGIDQKVLMLDRFAGMPAPSDYDLYRTGGELKPPQAQVDALGRQISTLGLEEHVEVLQGLFAETFARLRDRPLRFSFVHIDANIYQSTLEACEFTVPRVTPSGAVIFDDYNGLSDLGARLAIDKYLADRTAKPVPLAECSAYLTF